MGTELVLDGPMTIQRFTIVVVREFVRCHVAEITDVVNVLQVFEHRFTIDEGLVVAELARRVASEGLGVLAAGTVHVVAKFVWSVNCKLLQEGDALRRANFAKLAAIMLLTKMSLQKVEIIEGDL